MRFLGLNAITQRTDLLHMQNQPNNFDTRTTSHFLEIHMSEDDGFLLLCLTDTVRNEVVKLKLGLDHLKFKSSENGAEMVSFGQKWVP